MNEYTLIREDTSKALWNNVNQWFDSSPAKSMFADAKGICKTAVAEYLANQMGHTLFASMAKRDEYWQQREESKKILHEEARAERERVEREKRESQRKKEDAIVASAESKLTPKELKILKKKFRR